MARKWGQGRIFLHANNSALTPFFLACAMFAGQAAAQKDEYKFDVGQFEKKPYEFGGFLEAKGERQWLDPGAASREGYPRPPSVGVLRFCGH